MFVSWGASAETADCVARNLVDSDVAGIGSHGVIRIPSYYGFVEAGWLKPAAEDGCTYCVERNIWLDVTFEHCPSEWTLYLSILICIVVLK